MPNLSKPEFTFLKGLLRDRLSEHWREVGFNKTLEEYIIFPKYGEAARIYYFSNQVKAGINFPNLKRPEGSLPDMMLRDEKICEFLKENGIENNGKNWSIRPEAQILRWDKGESDEKMLDKIAFKAYLIYVGIEDNEVFRKKFQTRNQAIVLNLKGENPPMDSLTSDSSLTYRKINSLIKILRNLLHGKFFRNRAYPLILLSVGVLIWVLSPFITCNSSKDSSKLPGISDGKLKPMYDSICGEIKIEYNKDGYFIKGKRTGIYKGSINKLDYSKPQDLTLSKISYDSKSLFFKFSVKDIDQSEGFVDLVDILPKPEIMSGGIHYLYKDTERHWSQVNIIFKRSDIPIQINCDSINDPLCVSGKWRYTVLARL